MSLVLDIAAVWIASSLAAGALFGALGAADSRRRERMDQAPRPDRRTRPLDPTAYARGYCTTREALFANPYRDEPERSAWVQGWIDRWHDDKAAERPLAPPAKAFLG